MSAIKHSSVVVATVSPASYIQHNISLRTVAVWDDFQLSHLRASQQSIEYNHTRDRILNLPYHRKIFVFRQYNREIFFVGIVIQKSRDSIPGGNRVTF